MGHVVTWLCATASSVGGQWLWLAGLCPAALRPCPLPRLSLQQLGSLLQGISAELPRGGSSAIVCVLQLS